MYIKTYLHLVYTDRDTYLSLTLCCVTLMAAIISDVPSLLDSVLNEAFVSLPLDSTKVIGWRCGNCDGTWREGVAKRARCKWCPKCSPEKRRNSKVTKSGTPPARTKPKESPKTKTPKKETPKKECSVCYLDVPVKDWAECEECSFGCCKECLKRYICESPVVADCMSCHTSLTYPFLASVYGKMWVVGKTSEFYKHRLDIYTQRELAKIPATLPLVQKQEEINQLESELSRITVKIANSVLAYNSTVDDELPNDVATGMALYEKRDVINARMEQLRAEINGESVDTSVQGAYIQGCPTDGCKGLINGKTYACVVCNTRVCKKCRETLLGEEHTCNKDTLATVKALQGNTKPCPKCAVAIYKIDGCDQMWCVECKTAFSWKTGAIETRTIHNPHYFQWLRENSKDGEIPRNAGRREACREGELSVWHVLFYTDVRKYVLGNYDYWEVPMARLFAAIETNAGRRRRAHPRESNWMVHRRIDYITNKLSKERWVDFIYLRYSTEEQDQNQAELDNGLFTVCAEIIEEMYAKVKEANTAIEKARKMGIRRQAIRNKKKMLREYQEKLENVRESFIEYYAKANAHNRTDSFYVYTDRWLNLKYNKHIKAQKSKPKNPRKEVDISDDEDVRLSDDDDTVESMGTDVQELSYSNGTVEILTPPGIGYDDTDEESDNGEWDE